MGYYFLLLRPLLEKTSYDLHISKLTQTAAIVEGLNELIKREKRTRLLSLESNVKITWNKKISRSQR